jgi:hypothetical protein
VDVPSAGADGAVAAMDVCGFWRCADPRAGNAKGSTPLHRAAQLGAPEVVEFLLQSGSSANATDCDRETALHAAVRGRSEEKLQVLLRAGADPTIAGLHGTPADFASTVLFFFLRLDSLLRRS